MEIFYPLLGIALGWFLKELSTAFQESQDTKRRLGKAVSALTYLNREMVLIQRQFEVFKDLSGSHREFEQFRQYVLRKYPRRDEAFVNLVRESISTVAELAPLKALELDQIVNRYWFLQEAKLTEASKDYELYVFQLSSLEVGFELYEKAMERLVRKLAFMHGISTWMQLRRELKRLKNNNPGDSKGYNLLLDQFRQAKEKYTDIRSETNKTDSADLEK